MRTDIREFSHGVLDGDEEVIAVFTDPAHAELFKKTLNSGVVGPIPYTTGTVYQNFDSSASFSTD